ncbi:unnamed protein product [Pleuronectes platessa]|uniref:Uncharacterized protein n=1 Tax=Pleuronectes platessa TaxID=8262 RepID=A0A9N7YDX5_PLEPL|nr:unnamed protein product [Pleuronectes platessa]
MLGRHHEDGTARQREAESDGHPGGCQSWGLHASPRLASPVMLECSVCSGTLHQLHHGGHLAAAPTHTGDGPVLPQ